ncbi:MAG: metalloregulator ArsR/SmtB family transcription factor [Pseudomonadota bacterium]
MSTLDATLGLLRAIGEETRLRIVALLARGELTVTEITQILGQSQPRVSRHLKILADAGLVERHREGAWMFYRIAGGAGADRARAAILEAVGAVCEGADRVIARDSERFAQSREARAALASRYFQENAPQWNELRALHLPDSDIEQRMVALAGEGPFDLFVDLGTGAGRMLEIFADRFKEGVGYDLSHEMLSIARDRLEKGGVDNAQVRHGDLFCLPLENEVADIVCVHHVLHFLAEPDAAVKEGSRILKPGGRLIISDFAPHDLEFLREEHAHRRLGFADEEVTSWCASAGLRLEQTETLTPQRANRDGAGGRQLTVKIWNCAAPAGVRRLRAQRGMKEAS